MRIDRSARSPHASCHIVPSTSTSPSISALSLRIAASKSLEISVALGPTDLSVRDHDHFGWLRHAAAKSRSSAPIGALLVPVAHHLVHRATVDAAGEAASLLDEVTKSLGVGANAVWST